METNVVGIIPNNELKQGMFKTTAYTLVVTHTDILAAEITKQLLQAAAEKAKEDSKAKGEGFFKRMFSVGTSGFTFQDAYYQMTPEQILAESDGNFSIPFTSIEKIKWKQGDHMETNIPDRMELKTATTKYEFILKGSSIGQAKKILQSVIPNKV